MGYLALQCAWQKNEGIGIDTHVHRICQRLNWTHKVKNDTYTAIWSLRVVNLAGPLAVKY